MTVAENIWVGREPYNLLGLIDHRAMNRVSKALFDRLRIAIDPRVLVSTLSVAARQMIEIAKAVSHNSDVLIMDEPTSALTESEVSHLFEIIKELRSQGIGIIYITHKMNELFEIADEVSIFRDGRYVAHRSTADVSRDEIIRLMVGREITELFPKVSVPIGDVVLSVDALSRDGVFSNVSFELRSGEILGFAGLVGSGRSNVAEALFGVAPATSGTIRLDGDVIDIRSPGEAIRNGLAFLTEDRKETGCLLVLSVLENMQLAVLGERYVWAGFVRQRKLSDVCQQMSHTLRVKTPSMTQRIEYLSGGNQQKVLIGRWLLTDPRILILDEPTKGVDVGAKAEIHRLVVEFARKGVAIILISSELPEILGMSDRIAVMHEGRLTGILDRQEATQVKIMELASR
jgi:inositol transport system ATP-binding protein